MKKILVLIFGLFLFSLFAVAQCKELDITGRWAEKISERVVADVFKNENDDSYSIFITWREDNLAQKDIYRFTVKKDKNNILKYKNGTHIYRFYDSNVKYTDKIDYTDGSGEFKIVNDELIWIDNKNKNENTVFIKANKSFIKDTTVSSKLFSILLPQEVKNTYEVKKDKNTISVYHKDSKKAGFGGFAFGIRAYKNPSDHANLPGGVKIGELVDKKGTLYDMVLKYPTDVQYDYTKNNAPDGYTVLYQYGKSAKITGKNSARYYENQGMKGKDLYKEVLNKHVKAIKEKWDSTKLENEDMSYMYNVIASSDKNVMNKIGYTFYDINKDGIDELVIGEIAKGEWKGVIYDIYTTVNRTPKHVVSGGSRNRYFVCCSGSFVCNEYSSGALESGLRVYNLTENSTELFPQVFFKYDGYENKANPWFLSYGSDKWDNVTKEKYDDRKSTFDKYERFDFIPLSSVK